MIKKLVLLKNIIKGSSEKRILELLIKEAGEMGSFTSELTGESRIPPILINSLSEMIKNLLPNILAKYYPDKSNNEIKKFVNNNAINILYTKIEAPEDEGSGEEMTILDHYFLRAMDEYPSEEEAMAEEYTSFPAIDVDEPAQISSGPLSLMPKKEIEHKDIPQYSQKISEEILTDLLYQYVDTVEPLGSLDEDYGEFEPSESELHESEEDLEPSEDEIRRFLEAMNKQRIRSR